ncbi:MAG: response regulator [Leptospiraceae bacterium]|nr:response regulator [Leptospiraceae bacterium]
MIFKKKGHELKVFDNGKELTDNIKNENCDLILLDLDMPVLKGEETIQELFKLFSYSPELKIPIFVLSDHDLTKERVIFKNLGFK